jgi:hypothetical protein
MNGNPADTAHISFLIWSSTLFCLQYCSSSSSFEQSLVKYFTILLQEDLEVDLQMLEVGISSSH